MKNRTFIYLNLKMIIKLVRKRKEKIIIVEIVMTRENALLWILVII